MGNQSSSLVAALGDPENENKCRLAFAALDEDGSSLLEHGELLDLRVQLAAASRAAGENSKEGETHFATTMQRLDVTIQKQGVVDFELFRELLRAEKRRREDSGGGWSHLQKDVLFLVFTVRMTKCGSI